jgi:hypothetical protein
MKSAAENSRDNKSSPSRFVLLGASTAFALLGASNVANAKDAVATTIVGVNGDGFPAYVTENGQGLTPGTYAIGTIMVDYFVTGFQFPTDWHGGFRICLDTVAAGGKQAAEYPANIYVKQNGSSDLHIDGVVATVPFAGVNDDPDLVAGRKCVDIKASVPAAVAANPTFQVDGATLVANLQESADRKNIDTPTSVKVRVTLVHPIACVRAVHLVSNNDFTIDLGVAGISLSINKSNKRLASQPIDMQHLLALVNTCDAAQKVDVTAAINENFEVFQSNGIRTTSVSQEVADSNQLLGVGLEWDDLNALNPAEMCLLNVNVPAHQSFIFTQRMRVSDDGNFPGTYAGTLGRALGAWQYGGFTYAMNTSSGNSTSCPAYGSSSDEGEVQVPVKSVTVNGQGGGTQNAP